MQNPLPIENGEGDKDGAAMQFPNQLDPWTKWGGTLKDSPLYEGWVKAMQEYRKEVDADNKTL